VKEHLYEKFDLNMQFKSLVFSIMNLINLLF